MTGKDLLMPFHLLPSGKQHSPVIKKLPTQKSLRQNGFTGEIYRTFKRLTSKILQGWEHFQTYLMKAAFLKCPNQTEIPQEKKTIDQYP